VSINWANEIDSRRRGKRKMPAEDKISRLPGGVKAMGKKPIIFRFSDTRVRMNQKEGMLWIKFD